ncbi:hypothetical protein ANTPLA_LOCUS10992 [Anthophora plagiata]
MKGKNVPGKARVAYRFFQSGLYFTVNSIPATPRGAQQTDHAIDPIKMHASRCSPNNPEETKRPSKHRFPNSTNISTVQRSPRVRFHSRKIPSDLVDELVPISKQKIPQGDSKGVAGKDDPSPK